MLAYYADLQAHGTHPVVGVHTVVVNLLQARGRGGEALVNLLAVSANLLHGQGLHIGLGDLAKGHSHFFLDSLLLPLLGHVALALVVAHSHCGWEAREIE